MLDPDSPHYGAHMAAILALSTPARIATGLVFLAIILLLRRFGRFLIRAGAAIERTKHGPLPGVTPEASRRRDAHTAHEPERYDPFNAG